MIELTFPGLNLRQAFTPTNQEQLNTSDTDLGSSAPGAARRTTASCSRARTGSCGCSTSRAWTATPPSRARCRSAAKSSAADPRRWAAVHRAGGVAPRRAHDDVRRRDENATAAYVLRGGRLYQAWQNANPGTSPVMAGGLLYVYDPSGGGDRRLPPGLAATDRQAARRVRALEQPDRRRRARDRARGQRQRPLAQRHARDLLRALRGWRSRPQDDHLEALPLTSNSFPSPGFRILS